MTKFTVFVRKFIVLLPKSIVQSLNCLEEAVASGGCAPRPFYRCKIPYSETPIYEILVPKFIILVPKFFSPKSKLFLENSSFWGLSPQIDPCKDVSCNRLICHVTQLHITWLKKFCPKTAPHFQNHSYIPGGPVSPK